MATLVLGHTDFEWRTCLVLSARATVASRGTSSAQ
jgi:hypothetical protein